MWPCDYDLCRTGRGWHTERKVERKRKEAEIIDAITPFFHSMGMTLNDRFIVIGGAAMWLLGLRKDFDDLDLIVPDMVGSARKRMYGNLVIDAARTLLEQEEDTEGIIERAVWVNGWSVMCPADLLALKKRLNREKDQKDIKILEVIIELGEMQRDGG